MLQLQRYSIRIISFPSSVERQTDLICRVNNGRSSEADIDVISRTYLQQDLRSEPGLA